MRISGGYKTKQRESILECLRSNRDKHFTADDIVETLRTQGENVGRTTVYRYLDKLCDEGIVRKYVVADGGSACFQLCSENCREHFHLMCVKCGRLIHTECSYLSGVGEHVKSKHGFTVDPGRTVLYGMCAECAENGTDKTDFAAHGKNEKCCCCGKNHADEDKNGGE